MISRIVIGLAVSCLTGIWLYAQTSNELLLIDSLPYTVEIEAVHSKKGKTITGAKYQTKIGDYAVLFRREGIHQGSDYKFRKNLTSFSGDTARVAGKYENDQIYVEDNQSFLGWLTEDITGIEGESGTIVPGTEIINAELSILTSQEVWGLIIKSVDTKTEEGQTKTGYTGFASNGSRRIDLIWHDQHNHKDICDGGLSSYWKWVEFVENGISLGGSCTSFFLYRPGLSSETKFLITALMVAVQR